MASEPPQQLVAEHAYPLRVGCAAQGCAVAFLAVIGSAAAATLPAGVLMVQGGQVPLGVLLCVLSVAGLPALVFAAIQVVSGVREVLNPQQLFVTKDSLVLPPQLWGTLADANGNVPPNAPAPQPALLPFAMIRAVKTADGTGVRLRIEHDLAPEPLRIHEFLMTARDFDGLEAVLREAIPGAFVADPPKPPA